ncbi:hypothetical protein SAMN05421819_4156 [Bryocella elongata]|uniref:Uncharacterized protein n=1 Tax=Bryocella elongata TaxID=863522 RepID=A0A1H6C274_9BACT|nr:hypothetical protein SAMN05421819_4156 [Bryocella elongata]
MSPEGPPQIGCPCLDSETWVRRMPRKTTHPEPPQVSPKHPHHHHVSNARRGAPTYSDSGIFLTRPSGPSFSPNPPRLRASAGYSTSTTPTSPPHHCRKLDHAHSSGPATTRKGPVLTGPKSPRRRRFRSAEGWSAGGAATTELPFLNSALPLRLRSCSAAVLARKSQKPASGPATIKNSARSSKRASGAY